MLKNFLKLLTGNGLAQGIQLLSLSFLTIIYQPDDFGMLGKVQSVSAVVSILLTLQLQHVIPLSLDTYSAKKNTIYVFQTSFIITIILFFIFINFEKDYIYALLIAFSTATTAIISNLVVYRGKFGLLSAMYVFRAILMVSLQVLFYFFSIKEGLLRGAVLGEILSFLLFVFFAKSLFVFNFKLKIKEIKIFIQDWKAYSFFGTIQEVLSVMVYSLPIIFYVERFGENIGGQYSIAYKLIWAPTVLISSSLAQLLTYRFGKEKDFSFLKKIIWFDKRLLLALPLLFYILYQLRIWGNDLFDGKWSLAIILLPYMFINAVSFLYANPFRVALRVKKKNAVILIIELLTLILMTVVFFVFNVSVIVFTVMMSLISLIQSTLIVGGYSLVMKNK